jgi:prephenate dehydrogenase
LQPDLTQRVGVIGTGLIGGSIGLRARALGMRVTGWDADASHLQRAVAEGALDAAQPNEAAVVAESDTLVLALPLPGVLDALERFRSNVPPASLILDVASLKAPVVRAGAGLAALVPSHPIAGSERSGPEAARADLFEGHVWTYEPSAPAPALERARRFIAAMGARAVPIDAETHDRVAALTSHLPQVVAVALASQLAASLDDETLALCGSGVRSMTRLGASSWEMWEGILHANGPTVAQEVRTLAAVLSEIADELDAGRTRALGSRFATAAAAAASLQAGVPANDATTKNVR